MVSKAATRHAAPANHFPVRRLAHNLRLHVHVGIQGADRAIAVTNGLRNLLPEILALSASSPFHENVNTGLHSARTQVFTRFFPRCGVPDAFGSWGHYADYVRFLYRTGSVDEPKIFNRAVSAAEVQTLFWQGTNCP